ncbi:MAG TPA: hypothetical protein VH877_21095 [Polyangia bacterium]|nr:hypothetical protein [Polyangia bacterium]
MKKSLRMSSVVLLSSMGILMGAGCGVDPGAQVDHQNQAVCIIEPITQPAACNLPYQPLQFVCDVITQNTACDGQANNYYGLVNQLQNAICTKSALESYASQLNAAITLYQAQLAGASDYQTAMCAQQHIYQYQQQLQGVMGTISMMDIQIHCLNNQVAIAQCEFAKCLATPACKPILARGSGGAGASCTDGGQCQSGLCLAGTNTCAAPPIDYCCLAAVDNQCPTFQTNLQQCQMMIQQQQQHYPYP